MCVCGTSAWMRINNLYKNIIRKNGDTTVNIIKKINKLFKRDKRPDFIRKYDKYTDDELLAVAMKEQADIRFEVGRDGREYQVLGAAYRALIYRGVRIF
jgi:hypothetical protein